MGRRLSEANRDALLLELNGSVEEAAERTAKSVMDGTILLAWPKGLTYPPNCGFTPDEEAAVGAIRDIPAVEAALRKILASAAFIPLYYFVAVIDGIGDPRSGRWSGVSLLDLDDEDEETPLRYGLYDYYWKWREVRPDKGWRLDTLEGRGPLRGDIGG